MMAVRYAWTPASAACACAILRRSRLEGSVILATGLMLMSTRESICDSIVSTANVSEICCILSDEREVPLLCLCPAFRATGQCKCEGFMVDVDMELSPLEKVSEVLDSRVVSEHMAVYRP